MKHIKGLDTLRALCVICVIFEHWGVPFDDKASIGRFIKIVIVPNGADAVYVFFVLSGFLITSLLLRAAWSSEHVSRLHVIKNFIFRRALRIFPIYFLTLYVLYYSFDDIKVHIWYLLSYSLNILLYKTNQFVSTFSHSWTLAVEEQFYLFWPWFILFINRKYLGFFFAGIILTGIASTYLTMEFTHHIEPFLTSDCLDAFGIGGLCAYAVLNKADRTVFEKIIRIAGPIALAVRLSWAFAGFFNQPCYWIFLLKTDDSILAVWLITLIVNNKSMIVKKYLLENRFLNFIGKISYGIYIYHPYTIRFPFRRFDDRFVRNPFWHDLLIGHYFLYGVNVVLLISVCWLSFILIEMPLLNLKKYFKYSPVVSSGSLLTKQDNQGSLVTADIPAE